MNKIIFGVFAHPDDEAFGLAGTLLSEVKNGAELHLVCFTAGQNGLNPDNIPNLHEVRFKEWNESARMLGAFNKYHLGYVDGEIGNVVMLQAVDQIKKIMREVVNSHVAPFEVEIITMDTNGITGHIDHITVSRAAHHVFYDLKAERTPLKRLRMHCLPRSYTGDEPNTDFVFMEPSRLPKEIDLALLMNLSIIVVNLNQQRNHDNFLCPPILRDKLVMHISFSPVLSINTQSFPSANRFATALKVLFVITIARSQFYNLSLVTT